jgi:hypothetical protein
VVAFWGSSIYRGDDRRADWAFGFGLVAAASLVGVVATRSEDLVQALLGLMFLGSSVTALVLGLVVLGRRHVLAKVTVQKAFIGVALGSLVAVAVGFWVLSLIFAIHQGQNSLPFLSQENRITLNCVNAEERSGVPLGQAFDDCSGCPSSESRVEPVTGNGVNGTSSVDVHPGDGPGDDQLLDLAGALEDREDLGVAMPPLDRVVADVAGAAEDLDGVVGDPHGGLAGEQLGLGALGRLEPLAAGPATTRSTPAAGPRRCTCASRPA